MKLVFLLFLLSCSGNKPSHSGIEYRALTWSDFRAIPPSDDLTVAARTATEIVMEDTEIAGRVTYDVNAYFLPQYSYVRVRARRVLQHEQTHFQIAYIAAKRCMLDLRPLQNRETLDRVMADTLFNVHVAESKRRNEQFDQETNHGLDTAVEKIWEQRISVELRTFGDLSDKPYGRNHQNFQSRRSVHPQTEHQL